MTDLPLTPLSETASTITLGWTPPQGCRGYRFETNGKRSSTMDGSRASVKFAKPGPYTVEALGTLAQGTYPPPVLPPPASGFAGGYGLDINGKPWTPTEAANADMFVTSADQSAAAAKLNPHTLMYVDSCSVQQAWWAGIDYTTAKANGWIRPCGQSSFGAWCGDIGVVGYQDEWARQVIAHARAAGVFGVFVDDVMRDQAVLWSNPYPSWQQSEAAMLSFMGRVGPQLKAAGLYVLPNASGYVGGIAGSDDGSLAVTWAQALAPFVPGLMQEYWQQSPADNSVRTLGPAWWQHWDGWQRLPAWCRTAGVQFVGLTYGTSDQVEYARASALTADPGALVMSDAFGRWARVPGVVTVDPVAGVGSIG